MLQWASFQNKYQTGQIRCKMIRGLQAWHAAFTIMEYSQHLRETKPEIFRNKYHWQDLWTKIMRKVIFFWEQIPFIEIPQALCRMYESGSLNPAASWQQNYVSKYMLIFGMQIRYEICFKCFSNIFQMFFKCALNLVFKFINIDYYLSKQLPFLLYNVESTCSKSLK